MARKSGGGFRAPKNYEPGRGSKPSKAGWRAEQSGGAKPSGSGKSAAGKSAARPTDRPDGERSQRAQRTRDTAPAGARREPRADPPALPALPAVPPAPLEARRTTPAEVSGTTFSDLGLGGNIVRALAELGAITPFAIQAVTIPDILQGHHVLGRGRTGSGKTIAFGAALVERLLRLNAEGAFPSGAPKEKPQRGVQQKRPARQAARSPKALILAPTRELALQIDRTVQPIARAVGLYTGQFVGGAPFEPQLHSLARGVDIVIGTPGRIEDLSMRGHLNLGQVAVTVIDEADHMSELGFIEPVQRILRSTRRRSQRLLFSATLDGRVEALVAEFMPRPAIHEVVDDAGSSDEPGGTSDVTHRVLIVMREQKDDVLMQLVVGGGRTVVFCRTRAYAEMVTERLTEAGVKALALHGDLSQARRERNLAKFTEGNVDVLVATVVDARGIHVDDIDTVLQADPPDDPKAYVHRAGRTGRVGKAGSVITLIPRTRQKRTRELFEAAGIEPDYFGDFEPGDTLPN